MNYLFRALLLFLSIFCLFPLSGCGDENPAEVRDFRVKYFRHKLFNQDFVDASHGWVCGDYGLIWKTTDGGSTWLPLNSGTILPLRGISFTDRNKGWAVGDQGVIVHTSDGGKTWERQESGITEHLQDVEFLNAKTGIAVGVFAALLKTDDGGVHWSDISAKVKEEEKEFQFFIGEGAGSEGEEDADAGETLDFLEDGMPVLEPLLNDIFFVDSRNGWIAAEEGNIFYTPDAGTTWEKQKSPFKEDLFSVFFKDPQEGWITGLNGLLLHTTDGGTTWQKQDCPIEESLFGIVVTNERGYAVGNAASMMATKDGGVTWEEFTPSDLVLYSWLRSIHHVEGKFIAIGGLGTILIGDDSENWRQAL